MTVNCFVDTNLLVYSRDASEPVKQPIAAGWLKQLWSLRCGRVSTQVISEYYVTLTVKLNPGLPREVAWEDVENLFSWNPVAIDAALLKLGRSVQDRYGFAWWDALVIAAAQTAGCRYLLTEDLQDGQSIGDLTVLDPFLHSTQEIGGLSAG